MLIDAYGSQYATGDRRNPPTDVHCRSADRPNRGNATYPMAEQHLPIAKPTPYPSGTPEIVPRIVHSAEFQLKSEATGPKNRSLIVFGLFTLTQSGRYLV